jgi:hypothetical protein
MNRGAFSFCNMRFAVERVDGGRRESAEGLADIGGERVSRGDRPGGLSHGGVGNPRVEVF